VAAGSETSASPWALVARERLVGGVTESQIWRERWRNAPQVAALFGRSVPVRVASHDPLPAKEARLKSSLNVVAAFEVKVETLLL